MTRGDTPTSPPSEEDVDAFARAWRRIRERMEAARRRSSERQNVGLVGVSKRHPIARLELALRAGLEDFGENYAQEYVDKRNALATRASPPRWHFIGPLQSNKAKLVAGCTLVHTVDRPKILAALERQRVRQDVLIQVNIAGEAQKAGAPEAELPDLLSWFSDSAYLRCRGLMLIPPAGSAEDTRTHFQALRRLRDRLSATARPNVALEELSMGMSGDFEVAIEEGATWVRVGTALFGPRPDL